MSKISLKLTRRELLRHAALPTAGAILLQQSSLGQASTRPTPGAALPLPVLSKPDMAFAYLGDTKADRYKLEQSGTFWTVTALPGTGKASSFRLQIQPTAGSSKISVESPTLPIQRIHLRWNFRYPAEALALGDAWERSYGDLEWRPLEAERVLPWYAMLHWHDQTLGMGVKTGAASFAFWQIDSAGISLWLDLRNGSNGVQLGQRTLEAATIVTHQSQTGESAFAATQHLCRAMAQGTQVPAKRGITSVDTIYGSNDWYYAYGQNTPEGILRDADLVRSVAPAKGAKAFTVIDDGYQDPRRFPSMAKLAADIRSRDVLPGIWIRPLRASNKTSANLLLPAARFNPRTGEETALAYDPTIPEALEAIAAVATQASNWGYDLIKHDFTTYELFGQWGSQMGASPAQGNWHFHDRSQTNAEIVTALYRRLRTACGPDRIIIGCNTVGHLSVGLFDATRTGDDVSGKEWERTRRTGVNTLAFRLPQHKIFHSIDANCIPLTPEIPWTMTQQWLSAVANSGTVLLISPDPEAIGNEEKQALRQAFELYLNRPAAEPLDWTETRTPQSWQSSQLETYQWTLEEGESPFPIGIQRGPA